MFHNLEKKVNHTIWTLFTIGCLAVALGVASLMDPFLAQFMVGILFFMLAYVTLHMAYRMQVMRDAFFHMFHLSGGSSEEKEKPTRKRK